MNTETPKVRDCQLCNSVLGMSDDDCFLGGNEN